MFGPSFILWVGIKCLIAIAETETETVTVEETAVEETVTVAETVGETVIVGETATATVGGETVGETAIVGETVIVGAGVLRLALFLQVKTAANHHRPFDRRRDTVGEVGIHIRSFDDFCNVPPSQ